MERPANAGRAELLSKLLSCSYSQINNLTYTEDIVKEVRSLCLATLGSSPCLWQIRVALAVLKGETDVICVARTGAGKSLTFYLPLLVRTEGITIVVVPLNALASEMASRLTSVGLPAVVITAATCNDHNFVDITKQKYRVVITNPETLLEKNGRFMKLFRDRSFLGMLIAIIIDEVHCVVNWGTFRPEYREMGILRYVIPPSIPLFVASATLPPVIMRDVRRLLHIRPDSYEELMSNDRPNVSIIVRRMTYPLKSFWDLSFLIPEGWTPTSRERPLLFLVMFDSISVLHQAVMFLRGRLPKEHRNMVLPFHSEMSEEHRLNTLSRMKTGSILGICASEGFGLGIDVPKIRLVVQWRANRVDFCTLTQRFGRAARDPDLHGVGLLLVEPTVCAEEKKGSQDKKKRRQKKQMGRGAAKRRRVTQEGRVGLPREDSQVTLVGGNPDAASSQGLSQDLPSQMETCEVEEEGAIDAGDQDDDEAEGEDNEPSTSTQRLGGDVPSIVDLQERWEEYFDYCAQQRNLTKTNRTSCVDPAVRDLVKGISGCRRIPWKVFFSRSRDLASILDCGLPTSVCRPPAEGPCPRCEPPPPKACCDLDSPALLDFLPKVPHRVFPKKKARSKFNTKPTMPGRANLEESLTEALEAWRDRESIAWFGDGHQDIHGGDAILPDSVLYNIVNYASNGKIKSMESLIRESQWSRARKYGQDVLRIINSFFPIDEHTVDPIQGPTPTPLGASSVTNGTVNVEPPLDPPALVSAYPPSASTSSRKKGVNKCSLCGSIGHIKSKRCPLYSEYIANKENDA